MRTPLFEGSKKERLGKTFDRLGTKKDGLKLDWGWSWPGQNEKEPQQICGAILGNFNFVVVQWYYGYEAELGYGYTTSGGGLLKMPNYPYKTGKEDMFKTRIECQLFAEGLLQTFKEETDRAVGKINKK